MSAEEIKAEIARLKAVIKHREAKLKAAKSDAAKARITTVIAARKRDLAALGVATDEAEAKAEDAPLPEPPAEAAAPKRRTR